MLISLPPRMRRPHGHRRARRTTAVAAAVAAIALVNPVVAAPASVATAAAVAPAKFFDVPAAGTSSDIGPSDPRLRYEGRWKITPSRATTVNSGSRMFLRFNGSTISAAFDLAKITQYPVLYVYVDGVKGRPITVDHSPIRLTPARLARGKHTLVMAAKTVSDQANRWDPPLQSALQLTGLSIAGHLDAPPPAPSVRFTFLGDSITQGLNLRCEGTGVPSQNTDSYCSDATLDYAWLTAAAFGSGLEQVGFGFQGITVAGSGNVPPAPAAFPYNFHGSPISRWNANVVVINQGTNDMIFGIGDSGFTPGYLRLLREVRGQYPRAFIIALEPFGIGGLTALNISSEIQSAVGQFKDPRTAFVATRGWLLPTDFNDEAHPNVQGHKTAARQLIAAITRLTGLKPLPLPRIR